MSGDGRHFHQPGKRIVPRGDRSFEGRAQRTKIGTNRHTPTEYLAGGGGQVGRQPHPTDARRGRGCGPAFTERELERDVREVSPGCQTDRVPTPCPRVQVEDLQLPGTRIPFELDFDETGEAKIGDETRTLLDHLRIVDRFHEGAGPTEIHRHLPGSTRRHRRVDLTFPAGGPKRQLACSAAGDDLLDHHVSQPVRTRTLRHTEPAATPDRRSSMP